MIINIYIIFASKSRGEFGSDLILKTTGPIVHSKRLTTAGRILRLYVATENPSENLIILIHYESMRPCMGPYKNKILRNRRNVAYLETDQIS